MIRRLGWGIADQALSSLTNFALGFVLARTVDAADFGAFSLAFATYALALNVARALASQPLVVRYSGVDRQRARYGVAACTGMSLLLGVLLGLACIVVGLLGSGSLREAFVALGLTLPGLLLQDSYRYVFFAGGRDSHAFANDATWAVFMVVTLGVVIVGGRPTVFGATLAWGISASVAAVVGRLQSEVWPLPTLALRWWREHRELSPRFVGEYVTTILSVQIPLFALGAFSGLSAVGSLRAGQLLLGPLNIVFQGIGLVAIPEGVAMLRRSSRQLRRGAVAISVGLAAVALAWGALVLLLPDDLGRALLGGNWSASRPVMLPLTLGLAASGAIVGAFVVLRSLGAARRSLGANSVVAALTLVGGVGGAFAGAAPGVAWAQAITNSLGVGIWWRSASAGLRDHQAEAASIPAAPEPAG